MAAGARMLAALAKGRVDSMYYLCGEERFLVDRAVRMLKEAVLGRDTDYTASLAYDRLVASDAGVEGIVSAARTLPMLAKRRMVLVRQAEALNSKMLEPLLVYARAPNPSTCLVLVGEKADMRTKVFVELDRLGVLWCFDRLRDREVPAWLAVEARAQGLVIEADAAQLLVESLGADLAALASALERLALYAGAGATIRASDVEATVSQARSRSVFELCAAVGRGDLRVALLVLARLLYERESGVGIVAMLARHFRQMWMFRELDAAGANEAVLAKQLGIHPYFVSQLREPARRLSAASLRRIHSMLCESDRRLKSSRLDERHILEICVLGIARVVNSATAGRMPTARAGLQPE